jgi:hypothetical protein
VTRRRLKLVPLIFAAVLMILVSLAIVAWFKYILPELHRYDRENEAASNVYNNGGALMKDGQVLITLEDSARKKFGDRQLTAMTPSLSQISRFYSLDLHGTSITDAGIAQLAAVDQLQALNVSDTPVTLNGLLSLQRLPKLTAITVSPGQLTDSEMKKLYSVFHKPRMDFGVYLGAQRQLDPSTTSPSLPK